MRITLRVRESCDVTSPFSLEKCQKLNKYFLTSQLYNMSQTSTLVAKPAMGPLDYNCCDTLLMRVSVCWSALGGSTGG